MLTAISTFSCLAKPTQKRPIPPSVKFNAGMPTVDNSGIARFGWNIENAERYSYKIELKCIPSSGGTLSKQLTDTSIGVESISNLVASVNYTFQINLINTLNSNVIATTSTTTDIKYTINTSGGLYSVKKVNSPNYTGPIVRLRNDNGASSMYDDFYANSATNVTSLTNTKGQTVDEWRTSTGIASTNVFVDTWYDQSQDGKGNHASQATLASQPMYLSDTRQISFASSRFFNLPNGTVPFNDTKYTVVFQGNAGSPGTLKQGYLGSGNYGTVSATNAFRTDTLNIPAGYSASYRNYWWTNDAQSGSTNGAKGYKDGNVITWVYDSVTIKCFIRLNTDAVPNANTYTAQSSASKTGRSSTAAKNTIGTTNTSEYWEGTMTNLFIYTTNLSIAAIIEAETLAQITT